MSGRTGRMPGSRFPGDAAGGWLRPGSQVEGAGLAGQVTGRLDLSPVFRGSVGQTEAPWT